VPAFLLAVPVKLLPAAAIMRLLSLENAMPRNKPLMVLTRHWKSIPVLPMFRADLLASDPGFRRARLNLRG
jgi:hypothetical protein